MSVVEFVCARVVIRAGVSFAKPRRLARKTVTFHVQNRAVSRLPNAAAMSCVDSPGEMEAGAKGPCEPARFRRARKGTSSEQRGREG